MVCHGLISVLQDTFDVRYFAGENRDPEEGSNELYGHEKIRETGVFYIQYLHLGTRKHSINRHV